MKIRSEWLYVIIGVVLYLGLIVIHEETHAVIFEQYGCRYHFVFWKGSPATASDCPEMSEAATLSMIQSQANVEAVQYPLFLFILIIVFFMVKGEVVLNG